MPELPLIVGVVNATPDSFYDGGRHADAVAHAESLVAEGADWIDVGGESTRAGAASVDEAEELRRVLPVVRALAGRVTVSIDTVKPRVAAAALAAGATVLNDVSGLRDPEMVAVSADAAATVVMHMRGTPATMVTLIDYQDLVEEVRAALLEAAARARSPEVWIDPGIGFAKTAPQSLLLLRRLDRLVDTGLPVLLGASRKSFIGRTLGVERPDDRLPGSLAAALWGAEAGVGALRVHDVAATRQALHLWAAIQTAR